MVESLWSTLNPGDKRILEKEHIEIRKWTCKFDLHTQYLSESGAMRPLYIWERMSSFVWEWRKSTCEREIHAWSLHGCALDMSLSLKWRQKVVSESCARCGATLDRCLYCLCQNTPLTALLSQQWRQLCISVVFAIFYYFSLHLIFVTFYGSTVC